MSQYIIKHTGSQGEVFYWNGIMLVSWKDEAYRYNSREIAENRINIAAYEYQDDEGWEVEEL